ncbi:P-loop containing nucleoside triphosphate hydrolase protein [Lipomyces starkeyi]
MDAERALDILLLDEATEALDVESEKAVLDGFDNLTYKPTIISIAHRLNTIRDSDAILVMDQGRVVEQGTHQQLIKIRGKYFEPSPVAVTHNSLIPAVNNT